MEKGNKLEKVYSKYLIEKIFDYIDVKHFKFKLFKYSKLIQNRFDIKIIDYQSIYLNNNIYYLTDYLGRFAKENCNLNEFYEKFLSISKINKNDFETVLENVKNNNSEKIKNNEILEDKKSKKKIEPEINIENADDYFDLLNKLNIINNFSIVIDRTEIKKLNNKNKYISYFDKINKLNINYPSLKINLNYNNNDDDDINNNYNNISLFMKDLNIDLFKIKKVEIFDNSDHSDDFSGYEIEFNYRPITSINIPKSFIETILSFKNLVFLSFNFTLEQGSYNLIKIEHLIELDSFKFINNLYDLKYLYLLGIKIDKPFILELYNLISLKMINCSNISLSQDSCYKIKNIDLYGTNIVSESLLKFPNLEKLKIGGIPEKEKYPYINFQSLKELKKFEGDSDEFLLLDDNTPLNNVIISSYDILRNEKFYKILKKILSLKKLKKIKICYENIENNKALDEIKDINSSVNKITLKNYKNESSKKMIINNILAKFPNLSEVNFDTYDNDNKSNIDLKIIENINCKIDKIELNFKLNSGCFELYTAPFEKIKEIKLCFSEYYNLKNFMPIFHDECKIIFKSLIKLDIGICLSFSELNNLYNNLDFMPNLKSFYIICINNDINEEFHKKFLNKILSLDLKKILFELNIVSYKCDIYSREELKNIYPKIDFNKYDSIIIFKY